MESFTCDCLTLPLPLSGALRWVLGDLDSADLLFGWEYPAGERIVLWVVNVQSRRGLFMLRRQIRYWKPVALIFQTEVARVLALPGLRRGITYPGHWTRCWLAWPPPGGLKV